MRSNPNGDHSRRTKNPISAIETGQMRPDMKYLLVPIGEIDPVTHSRVLVNNTIKKDTSRPLRQRTFRSTLMEVSTAANHASAYESSAFVRRGYLIKYS
jgi:hypothetical protein